MYVTLKAGEILTQPGSQGLPGNKVDLDCEQPRSSSLACDADT